MGLICNFGEMRVALLTWLIFCHMVSMAEVQVAKFTVPVDFEVVNGDISESQVYIRRGSETVASVKGARSMRLKLDFNAEYRLDFTKPGYITKSISVHTYVSDERRKSGFEPYKIGVRLFKQYDGVNIVVYNQPVAFIRFLPENDEFGYDTDYTRSILSALQTAEETLEKKSVEERRQDKAPVLKKIQETPLPSGSTITPEERVIPSAPVPVFPDSRPVAPSVIPVASPQNTGSALPSGAGDHLKVGGSAGSGGDDLPRQGTYGGGEHPVAGDTPAAGDEQPPAASAGQAGADLVPAAKREVSDNGRHVEIIREKNRTVTIFQMREGDKTKSFKMVQYDWGGIYYFIKESQNVSQHLFDFYTRP